MYVDQADPSCADEWDGFLAGRPDALIYHSWRYGNLLRDLLGCHRVYWVARDDGGRVRGILPAMVAQGPWGRVYNSLPFFGSTGGVVAESPEAEEALRRVWCDQTSERGTLAATWVENPLSSSDGVPADVTDFRIGQWTDLDDGLGGSIDERWERLWRRFSGSARRNVRRALQAGVRALVDPEELPSLRALHVTNMAAIGGRPKPDAFFERLDKHLRSGEDFSLYVARWEGRTIAALLLLYSGSTVEYFVPGVASEHRNLQPTALLVAEAMRNALGRGFRRWNWGGTWPSQLGVYRFKHKWSSVDRPYHYRIRIQDRAALERSSEELLRAYPYFYVVPFSALRARPSRAD